MTHSFDQEYWDQHWQADPAGAARMMAVSPPNPHLVREVDSLVPGTVLEAGCGAGAEAVWLASRGWRVTGVDMAREALDLAAERAAMSGVANQVRWVQADLTVWEPGSRYDLVTSNYAHPAIPQLVFYDRIASWVAPGGTLVIVGHLHHGHRNGQPPSSASVTTDDITARLDTTVWDVVTSEESTRIVSGHASSAITLHDVVVRATRRH